MHFGHLSTVRNCKIANQFSSIPIIDACCVRYLLLLLLSIGWIQEQLISAQRKDCLSAVTQKKEFWTKRRCQRHLATKSSKLLAATGDRRNGGAFFNCGAPFVLMPSRRRLWPASPAKLRQSNRISATKKCWRFAPSTRMIRRATAGGPIVSTNRSEPKKLRSVTN